MARYSSILLPGGISFDTEIMVRLAELEKRACVNGKFPGKADLKCHIRRLDTKRVHTARISIQATHRNRIQLILASDRLKAELRTL